RARHGDVVDAEVAQRVHHGVDHRGGGGDRAGLADALDAERVGGRRRLRAVGADVGQVRRPRDVVVDQRAAGEVAVGVVHGPLVEGLGDALGDAAVHLAVHHHGVDDLADVVDGDVVADADAAGLGVDLDGAQVRAVR